MKKARTNNRVHVNRDLQLVEKIYDNENNYLRENAVLSFLCNTSITAPKIRNHYTIDNQHAIQMEILDGHPFKSHKHSPREEIQIWSSIGKAIRLLHDETRGLDPELLGLERRTIDTLLSLARFLPEKLSLATKLFILSSHQEKFDNHSIQTLIHRDIRIDNIFIKNDSDIVLLDYENSAVGYPWGDLVRLIGDDLKSKNDNINALLTGYGVDHSEFWASYPILRLSYLLEMYNYVKLKGRQAEWTLGMHNVMLKEIKEITKL
ncbi:phosphotransferase [Pseudomonas frederiksbergensis]|uniref:phosphotransferase n=1 Tax=Pseudomonas frederiksbergensis TaxID=104087 RepID=UPI00197FC3AD|nr:phosphotransferase [Pseudomonas frederiksbergensis]MBN3865706.1 phosphotransferase [Pseudomonas frederiksbergensis]